MHTAAFSQIALRRQDIIDYEPLLKNAFKTVLDFTSYSLHFPAVSPAGLAPDADHPLDRAELDGDCITLPLIRDGLLLAVFTARGVHQEQIRPLLPHLPHLAALCLEQILLHKMTVSDPLTGLHTRHCLHQALTREIGGILGSIMPGPDAVADDSLQGHSACFGLILLDLDRFRQINERYGHLFGDSLLRAVGACLTETCPRQTLVCRLGGDSFGVLWPQASRTRAGELAADLVRKIGRISMRFEPLREDVGISACAGYVNYPQDLRGAQFQKAAGEQSWLTLEKTEKALNTAKAVGKGQVYSFRQILTQGGVVLEVLPMNRLIINLGRGVDAREGQRFLVWSRKFNGQEAVVASQGELLLGHYPPMYKAEISLVEVQADMAIAEILVQSDPDWVVEKGDRLTLLDDHSSLAEQRAAQTSSPQKDLLTGLYPYRDFLHVWQTVCAQSFCMALIRVESQHSERSPANQMQDEQIVQTLAARAESLFGPHALGGRYSRTAILYHVPDQSPENCARLARELLADERFADLDIRVGIAGHPFLDYSRSDTLENVRKALDHAGLLPQERIACFDSVSLNISADRLFAQGEMYDAIAEYKKALTADDANFLARNSLGVCYARLNKYAAARAIFQDLTARCPDQVMPLYNYGCACLKDADSASARQAFERVLEIVPGHLFALIRLGLMAENEGDADRAWTMYAQARALPDGERLAPRYLARLAFRRDDRDTARELLHQAITTNPQDALSFHLLAQIYLDRGDDPEIAESLARQSVHLKPDAPAFWDVLVTALEQQGKSGEAEQTRIRANAQDR